MNYIFINYSATEMKKAAAEIIAAVIPRKMARNRWRGILRYGITNAFRLRRQIKKSDALPSNYLAVVAIAKNEGPYFKEWLDWHISKGVDKFYIYDNESTDETKTVLKPYIDKGIVEYSYIQGQRMQLAAYDDCLERHRYDTRWLAFIDLDEFIVPVKHPSIPEFLKEFEEYPLVEINWLCYGSSGQQKKEQGGVMQRFRRHSLPSDPINRHVKSIINPKRVYNMIGCHEAARIDGKGVDGNGNIITRSWKDRMPVHDGMKINHYAVKSYQEFMEKKGKGRASGTVVHLEDEYFRRFDLNDIEDEDCQ